MTKHTRIFVQQFLNLCEKLVDERMLGEVTWVSDNGCVLHFFRRIVVQAGSKNTVISGPPTEVRQHARITISTPQTRITETEHDVRLARHEHHLAKAESVIIDRATTVIPLPFQPLVHAIPAWLRPQLRLITGMQFRGRTQEADLKKVHHKQVEELPAKEEIRILGEPAIALGKFVFAGWGDLEMEDESKREEIQLIQDQQRVTAETNLRHFWNRTLFFLGIEGAAALLLCVSLTYSPSNIWLGLILALLGMWPVWDMLCMDARARHAPVGGPVLVAGLAAGLTAATTIQLVFVSFLLRSIGLGCLGVMFLGLSVVLFRKMQVLRKDG